VRVLLGLYLLLAASASMAAPSSKRCDTFSSTDEVSAPMTILEIEKQAMAELLAARKERPEHPDLLFGYANAEWLGLKSMVQAGDEIVRYTTDKSSWERRSGHKGYALIRSGCIIKRFVTVQS